MPARMVCHCLLVEGPDGLVLVDTGLGLDAMRAPAAALGPVFLGVARPRLRPEETARRQVEALGFDPADVRHIVLTHLDLDHAGGLADFPAATVHVLAAEHAAAAAVRGFKDAHRYRAGLWAHGPRWALHEVRGETWEGFDAVATIDPGVLLVPLPGHSKGHCGVAVEADGGWILHAGDAYFAHEEVHGPARRCPPGLEVFQAVTEDHGPTRRANQDRLRALANAHGGRPGDRPGGRVRVVCSHDPGELAACRAGDAAPLG